MMKDQPRSYNNIFITGMPGSGKSTFGRIYALLSGRSFLDFDDFFEKSLNTTISKIFTTKGLQGFRTLESKALQSLVHKNNCIIALGGGTLLAPENYEFAHQNGLIVSLVKLPINDLAQRIWQDKLNTKARVRPLFSQCENIEQVTETLKDLHQKRAPAYAKADIILNQDLNSIDNLILTLMHAEQNF